MQIPRNTKKKNFKNDWLNFLVEWQLLKLVEVQKLKLGKRRIDFKMLLQLLVQLFKKELFPVEELHYSKPHVFSMVLKRIILINNWVSKLFEMHVLNLLVLLSRMPVGKEVLLQAKSWMINLLRFQEDMMLKRENLWI